MSYQLRPTQPSQQGGGYDAYNGYGYGGYPQQPYAQQQHPDMMHAQSQPPSPGGPPLTMPPMYNHDGLVRTQTWIANQPPAMSPPPPAKTPFSECTGPTDSSFDRRTLGGYSATMPPRPPKEDMRVLGIKRNHFFIVLAVGLFILVAAFAIGLGVGLGTRKSSSAALDSTSGNSGCVTIFHFIFLLTTFVDFILFLGSTRPLASFSSWYLTQHAYLPHASPLNCCFSECCGMMSASGRQKCRKTHTNSRQHNRLSPLVARGLRAWHSRGLISIDNEH